MSTPTIAILALQGAFIEHERMLTKLGASCFEIRNRKDLERPMDGLILPGGESTVQGKLLKDEGLFAPLQDKIRAGLPVLATCAGMILLAEHLENDANTWFATLPVTVRRNAYGRQLGSFITTAPVKGIGDVKMNFIRAPTSPLHRLTWTSSRPWMTTSSLSAMESSSHFPSIPRSDMMTACTGCSLT